MWQELQKKCFLMLCRVSCYIWQLVSEMAFVKLNICNPSCIMNFATSLDRVLTQLKCQLLVANVVILWIKFSFLRKITFLSVHFSKNKNHTWCHCLYFPNYYYFFNDFWITSIYFMFNNFEFIKKITKSNNLLFFYIGNHSRTQTVKQI